VKTPIVSFVVAGAHPQDIGTLLDKQGVAVRTGHHCTMPLMQRLGLPGTVRASFGLYNSVVDVERLVVALRKAQTFL
jgi:cysteine desulfurase/selenocysteine lyase